MTLTEALNADLYKSHHPNVSNYTMDGKGKWEWVYYPIMADGKTQKPYPEPRVLMVQPKMFNGEMGQDFREVPLRYIERIEAKNGKK